MEVINAKILVENSFKFIKFPIWPPINTANSKNRYSLKSNKNWFLVNCPIIPKIEFIKINKETVVAIYLGFAALNI